MMLKETQITGYNFICINKNKYIYEIISIFINESLNNKNKSKVLKDILDKKYKIKDKKLIKLLNTKLKVNESMEEGDVKSFLSYMEENIGQLIDDTVSRYQYGDTEKVEKALRDLEDDLLDLNDRNSMGYFLLMYYSGYKNIDVNDPTLKRKYTENVKEAIDLAIEYETNGLDIDFSSL